MDTYTSAKTASTVGTQDDIASFQMWPILRDFKLSVELFASYGDKILLCGKGHQKTQGYLLVVYDILSSSSFGCNIRLHKVVKLYAESVKQLETIPALEILLLLKDDAIGILDMNTLDELMTVSNKVSLFATSCDMLPSPSAATTQLSMSTRTSSFTSSEQISHELRICVVSKRGSLSFFRWRAQQMRSEEDKNMQFSLDSRKIPQTVALSGDRLCIGYEKSYIVLSLKTGNILHELPLPRKYSPIINHLPDLTRWCIQMDTTTVFLDSDFDPTNEKEITWNDIPSTVVQIGPYVLALINQSIHICLFDGKRVFMMQQILQIRSSPTEKCRLWMDTQTKKVYAATSTTLFLLEPIPIDIQIKQFVAIHKYDRASTIIRVVLGISDSPYDEPRMNNGYAKGDLDFSAIPKIVTFSSNAQVSTESSSSTSTSSSSLVNTSLAKQSSNESSSLWLEYYRTGTMYAFQLFHEENFKQAFKEFEKFLTDPAEVLCLFEPLSPNRWLTDSYKAFTAFAQQHSEFSVPKDFARVKLKLALYELQYYSAQLRNVFQNVSRQSPSQWLEVQSLVHDRLILRPVCDLLTMVETTLLKIYLMDNNHTLVDALLRSENHCLSSEVENELLKYNCSKELNFFYRKHNQHGEALKMIAKINSLPYEDTVLDYLSKLNNDDLSLVFQYVQPMVRLALQQNNDEVLKKILKLFTGQSIESSSSMKPSIIQFNPMKVFRFLKMLNENLAIQYLKNMLPKIKNVAAQQTTNNGINSVYSQLYKKLAEQLFQLTTGNNSENEDTQLESLQDDASNTDKDTMELRQTLPIQTTFTVINSKTPSSISVCQGDLITQTIDVIVVCSSSQYLFNAICAAGGDSMEASYDAQLDKNADAAIIAVKAEGDIKSKCVYFLPWKPNSDDSVFRTSIKTFVANAMSRAVLENYRSIAFPAIGCGQLGCSANVIAEVMVEEAYPLSQKHGISVMFVIQAQKTDVYDEFQKQIKAKQPLAKPTPPPKPISVTIKKGMIEVEKGDITTQKVDVIIVSSSSQYLRDGIISAAGQEVKTAYCAEFKSNPNAIVISTASGLLPSKRIFFVKWQPDNDEDKLRQSLVDLVWTVIQNVMAHKFTSLAFPAIGCGKYACSVDIVVKTLVKEIKNQINTRDLPLTVKFVIQSAQQNIYDEFCKQVLATQEDATDSMNLQVPSTWEKSKERKLRLQLSNTSDEYKTLATNFDKAMKGKYTEIIRIERIQNARWYIQYLVHSHQFQMRLNTNTERQLYHGCPESAVHPILDDCFNRSFAGVNGTLYGVGVYFSSNAAYSHGYAKVNGNGERHMFVARVLIGNTIKGDESMKTRPVGYDSTTDGNHIFVTYHDAQAYAEYLIIYK